MRTKNKIWASVCAFFAAVCSAFGLTQLNTQTQATAETSAVVGLQSATLNRIEASNKGIASNVDYIEFDGLNDDVWFLTHFTGKNVPNFAVNAKGGYATWNKDMWNATDGGAGIVLASTHETSQGYGAGGLVVANKLDTTSSHGTLNKNSKYLTAMTGDAPMGMSSINAETEYIMILGWDRANGATQKGISYYLYSVDNGTLNEVGTYEFTIGTTTPTGSKAVIYGNIGTAATEATTGKESISFNYATPAATLDDLLNGISSDYAYKTELMNAHGVYAPIGDKASLTRVNLTEGASVSGVQQDYMLFDGFKDGEAVSTYFLVQHTGKNIPNFAVNATQAYDTWSTSATHETAGIGLYQSYQTYNATNGWGATWGALMGANGLLSHANYYYGSGATNTGLLPGIGRVDDNTEYLTIVGFEPGSATATAVATYKWYLFKLTNGGLELVGSQVGSANTPAAKGQYAVIYPNINNGPTEITFNYVAPKMTLEEVIMGVADDCVYKAALFEYFNISTKTLTMQNAAGNVIGTKQYVAGASYVLPESKLADFVGWEYNGALYAAGDSIEADDNITVKAVCMDVDMLDGASARLKIDNEGNGGLRFTVKVKTSEFAALGDKAQLRGVLIPTDKIDGEFDLTEETAKDIPLSDGIEKNDGYTYYHITLTNVLYSNYNREFSARAYVKVTYQDGDTENVLVTAYSKDKNSRSIYDIAVDAYNDGYEKDGVLAQYIGNTVNLAYSVDTQENYVLSVITNEDGLNNTSIRNYVIESQSVSTEDGVTSFTVTIKFNVSNLDFEKTPVTLWATGATKGTRIVKPVESVDEENNTVTCFFTLA